jgi:hypothetical protein
METKRKSQCNSLNSTETISCSRYTNWVRLMGCSANQVEPTYNTAQN